MSTLRTAKPVAVVVRLLAFWFCFFVSRRIGNGSGGVSFCCHAQETPFFDTAKFDPTANHRTNVCDRHRQLYLDNITLPNALRGLNLSVVLTNYTDPFARNFFGVSAETSRIDEVNVPLFAVILDEIAERAGFAWRDTFGVVTPINSETDGDKTWSDLLRWEVETYDIAMGKWDRTPSRLAAEILFPEGWYDASVILVQADHPDDKSMNLWSFLLPFQPAVWVTIFVTGIVSGLLYYGLEKLDEKADRRYLESNPIAAVYYSFISLAGHNEFLPQTHPARLLAFSMALFALIILAVYTANLASFLVVRRQPEGIITSVQEAVLMGAPICLQGAVALDQFITDKYPAAVLVRKATEGQVFEAVVRGTECPVALVPVASYETYRRNSAVNPDCTLHWQGRVEQYIQSGIATTLDSGAVDAGYYCTSVVNAVLDYYLLEMRADGFLDRAWENHLERVSDQMTCLEHLPSNSAASSSSSSEGGGGSSSSDEETYSLSIHEMAGVFIVHGFLCFTAGVIALVQYWFRQRKVNKKECTGEADPTDQDMMNENSSIFYEDDELAIQEEEEEAELRQLKEQLEKQKRRVSLIRASLGKPSSESDDDDDNDDKDCNRRYQD